SRSSRPLTGSTAGINADTKGAGDEEKSRRRNEHSKDEAAQKVAQREQSLPLSPVAGQSSGRFRLDHGFKGSRNRLQCGHKAAPETFTAAIGPEVERNWSQVMKCLWSCAGIAPETTRRDAGEGSGSTSMRASFRVGCRIARPEI